MMMGKRINDGNDLGISGARTRRSDTSIMAFFTVVGTIAQNKAVLSCIVAINVIRLIPGS